MTQTRTPTIGMASHSPKSGVQVVRALPFKEWPTADRSAWTAACQPAERLKRGGTASHLSVVTRNDLVQRYGYFLDHIQRTEGLICNAEVASYVTANRVEHYIEELKARVSSTTVHGSIYKLRRMTQLLAPRRDVTWLIETEKDLALVRQPRSKFDRLVHSEVLVEAGLSLMVEADGATHRSSLARARQFRDGLMVALLALCPIRLKNFAALEINRSFKQVDRSWWIVLAASDTKERRTDERPVPAILTPYIDRYIGIHRPSLARKDDACFHLWLSSNDGCALTYSAVEAAISKTTLATVGTNVSPHLFRTAAASTAAVHAGSMPHLASALLHHTNPAVTEEHYNRASSLSAAQIYASIIKGYKARE